MQEKIVQQKGSAPIVIIVIIAILAVGGYWIYKLPRTMTTSQTPQATQSTPIPSSKNESTNSAETANWKTYRAPGYIGFKLKFPYDQLKKDITEHTENTKDKLSQDENLVLWQTTIELKDSTIFIIRKHNLNPSTGKVFDSLIEYDSRIRDFSSVKVDNFNAKDSRDYITQAGKIQREVISNNDKYIWTIQEIRLSKNAKSYFDQILSTFKFLP